MLTTCDEETFVGGPLFVAGAVSPAVACGAGGLAATAGLHYVMRNCVRQAPGLGTCGRARPVYIGRSTPCERPDGTVRSGWSGGRAPWDDGIVRGQQTARRAADPALWAPWRGAADAQRRRASKPNFDA